MGIGLDGQRPICMRCGSDHVRYQTTSEGLWAAGGEGVAWVCESCHHIGAPFLVRGDGPRDPRADLWSQEYSDAAFQIENETWQAPDVDPARVPTSRLMSGAFILLGTLFLAPVAAALYHAFGTGILITVLHALVATGWLLAIGLVLLVVGIRRLRGPEADPVPQAHDVPLSRSDVVEVEGAPEVTGGTDEKPTRTSEHA